MVAIGVMDLHNKTSAGVLTPSGESIRTQTRVLRNVPRPYPGVPGLCYLVLENSQSWPSTSQRLGGYPSLATLVTGLSDVDYPIDRELSLQSRVVGDRLFFHLEEVWQGGMWTRTSMRNAIHDMCSISIKAGFSWRNVFVGGIPTGLYVPGHSKTLGFVRQYGTKVRAYQAPCMGSTCANGIDEFVAKRDGGCFLYYGSEDGEPDSFRCKTCINQIWECEGRWTPSHYRSGFDTRNVEFQQRRQREEYEEFERLIREQEEEKGKAPSIKKVPKAISPPALKPVRSGTRKDLCFTSDEEKDLPDRPIIGFVSRDKTQFGDLTEANAPVPTGSRSILSEVMATLEKPTSTQGRSILGEVLTALERPGQERNLVPFYSSDSCPDLTEDDCLSSDTSSDELEEIRPAFASEAVELESLLRKTYAAAVATPAHIPGVEVSGALGSTPGSETKPKVKLVAPRAGRVRFFDTVKSEWKPLIDRLKSTRGKRARPTSMIRPAGVCSPNRFESIRISTVSLDRFEEQDSPRPVVIPCGPRWVKKPRNLVAGGSSMLKSPTLRYQLPPVRAKDKKIREPKRPRELRPVLPSCPTKLRWVFENIKSFSRESCFSIRSFKRVCLIMRKLYNCPTDNHFKISYRGPGKVIFGFVEPTNDLDTWGVGISFQTSREFLHMAPKFNTSHLPICQNPSCNKRKEIAIRLLNKLSQDREPVDNADAPNPKLATRFQVEQPSFGDRMMGRKLIFRAGSMKVWTFSRNYQRVDSETGFSYNTGSSKIWDVKEPMFLTWSGFSRLLHDRKVQAGNFWAPWEVLCNMFKLGEKRLLNIMHHIPFGPEYPDVITESDDEAFSKLEETKGVDVGAVVRAGMDDFALAPRVVLQSGKRQRRLSDPGSPTVEGNGNFVVPTYNNLLTFRALKKSGKNHPTTRLANHQGKPHPNPGPVASFDITAATPITPGGSSHDFPNASDVLSGRKPTDRMVAPYLRGYKCSDIRTLARQINIYKCKYGDYNVQAMVLSVSGMDGADMSDIVSAHTWKSQELLDSLPLIQQYSLHIYEEKLLELAQALGLRNCVDSATAFMFAAKSYLGCPASGTMLVRFDSANSTVFIKSNPLDDRRAAYFFYDFIPLGHAGPPADEEGSVTSSTSLYHIWRLDETGIVGGRVVSHSSASSYIIESLSGDHKIVEEAFDAMTHERRKAVPEVEVQGVLFNDPHIMPMQVRDAMKNVLPKGYWAQSFIDTLGSKTSMYKHSTDNAEQAYGAVFAVLRATRLSLDKGEIMSFLSCWKAIRGCPRLADVFLYGCESGGRVAWRVISANREDERGGLYVFVHGEFIGHTGFLPEVYESVKRTDKFRQESYRKTYKYTIPSPSDMSIESPRHNPGIVNMYEMDSPRHKEQDEGLRINTNSGVHHLPRPLPYSCAFYMYHVTASNVWFKPNCFSSFISFRFFSSSLCVYGSDEVPFVKMQVHLKVVQPKWTLTGRPFCHLPKHLNEKVDVILYNANDEQVDHLKTATLNRFVEALYKLAPGRLKAELGRPKGVDLVSHASSCARVAEMMNMADAYAKRNDEYDVTRRRKYIMGEIDQWCSIHEVICFDPDCVEYKKNKILWRHTPEAALLMYFIIPLLAFFHLQYMSLKQFAKRYRRPEFDDGPSPAICNTTEVYPSNYDISLYEKTINIRTFGTEGDTRPLQYIAKVMANVGLMVVVTHEKQDGEGLEDLRKGDLDKWIPAYAGLLYAGQEGYKAVFQPHADVCGKGNTYSLAPPKKYIKDVRFTDRETFASLPWHKQVMMWLADTWSETFTADVHIGVLKGCAFPRGITAGTPLKAVPNSNQKRIGWTSGSAVHNIMPSDVRDNFEMVPSGDHLSIFPRYSKIYCHGGAGTMQTGLACGVEMVSCDNTLDRRYKTKLTPSDLEFPDCMAIYGMLISQGYDIDLPWWAKPWASLAWYNATFAKWSKTALFNMAKLLVVLMAGVNHGSWLLLVYISLPPFLATVLKRLQIMPHIVTSLKIVWNFPLILYQRWWVAFILSVIGNDLWFVRLMQDVRCFSSTDFVLMYEPVPDHRFLRFPFGHWALMDTKTNDVYEGRFVYPGKRGMGAPFKLTRTKRQPAKSSLLFPVPTRIHTVVQAYERAVVKPYSFMHNCVSLLNPSVSSNSFFIAGLFSLLCIAISFCLAPSTWVLDLYFSIRGQSFYESRMAQDLGFAAARDGEVPELPELTEKEAMDDPYLAAQYQFDPQPESSKSAEQRQVVSQQEEGGDPDWLINPDIPHHVNVMENLSKELAALAAIVKLDTEPDEGFQDEVIEEAVLTTMTDAITKGKVREDPSVMVFEECKVYRPGNYETAVDNLIKALDVIKSNPSVTVFTMWLKGVGRNIYEFLLPALRFLSWCAMQIRNISEKYWLEFQVAFSRFIDSYYGESESKRIKTVWGPTGLLKGSFISAKKQLEASVAHSEFEGRRTFASDFDKIVNELKESAKRHGVDSDIIDEIGGDQYRRVRINKPVMSKNEAKMLGIPDGEWTDIPAYTKMVDRILERGVEQGSDGVIYGDYHQELLDRANERYEPVSRKVLPPELKAIAREAAETIFNEYPEAHAKQDIISVDSVLRYMEVKGKLPYSSGVPFIGSNRLRSRQDLKESGMLKVIMDMAMGYITSGVMPVDIYHTFGKSQVVSADKLINNSKLRTVTSTGMLHTFIENMFQHATNKRPTWRTTGIGSGMPLNQNMSYIWEKMAAAHNTYGGMYIEKDATAFDSGLKQFGFEVLAALKEKGFEDHPSGNGEAMASVLKAKYEAMQDAHMLKITQKPRANVVIGAPQRKVFKFLQHLKHPAVRFITDTKPEELRPGEILVVKSKHECPKTMSWNGMMTFGDKSQFKTRGHHHSHMVYDVGDFRSLQSDFEELANYDIHLLARYNPKNRGGATGQTATTSDNTWADKAIIITAWYLTILEYFPDTKMEEFYLYNIYFNQSDDATYHTHGLKGLKPHMMYKFQKIAHMLGSTLKLKFTEDICLAEYLSKFVRPPTAEDRDDLKAWKLAKMDALKAKYPTSPVPKEEVSEIQKSASPQFVVYQNINAARMRQTALRYYQASARNDRYMISIFQRAAGHATLTAFCPRFYDELAFEYCSVVNHMLQQYHIFQKFEMQVDQYGKPHVVQTNPRWKTQALSPRQLALLSLIKQHPFPSYLKVLKTHMEKKTGDEEAYERLMRKIGKGVYTKDELFKQLVDSFWQFTDNIPDEFSKKFMPTLDFIYPDNPFYTRNEIAAKHALWALLEEKSPDEINYQDLMNMVAQGPYSAIADPLRTWDNWQNPEWRQAFYDEGRTASKCQALVLSLVYVVWYFIDKFIYRIPYIGPLYSLFYWSFIGLPKIYGVLNTLYWHGTGRSSTVISQLMPRDPYIYQKRITGVTCDAIPTVFAIVLAPIVFLLEESVTMMENVARVIKKGKSIKTPPVAIGAVENPWTSYVDGSLKMLKESPHRRIVIDAPTSTGKSTMFPAAILSQRQHHDYDTIVILFPRKILRDSWSTPYDIKSQVLTRSVKSIDPSAQVLLMTYGHFVASRCKQIDTANTLVLFDEFHELSGPIVLSFFQYTGDAFLMSATPENVATKFGLKEGSLPVFAPEIKRRFPTYIEKVECEKDFKPDVVSLWQKMENSEIRKANNIPMDRVIVVVPTVQQVRESILALHNLGVTAHEVSRQKPLVPETGHLICTQIVDAGINISGATCLIDLGKFISISRGVKVKGHPWTDPARNKQRIGRVARFCPGYVIQPQWAGSGDPTIEYPPTSYFAYKQVAKFYGIPQLTNWVDPVDRDLPFLKFNNIETMSKSHKLSLLSYYVLVFSGAVGSDLRKLYNILRERSSLNEDYDWAIGILRKKEHGLGRVQMLDFEQTVALSQIKGQTITKATSAAGVELLYYDDPIIAQGSSWVPISSLRDDTSINNTKIESQPPDYSSKNNRAERREKGLTAPKSDKQKGKQKITPRPSNEKAHDALQLTRSIVQRIAELGIDDYDLNTIMESYHNVLLYT